MSPKPIPPERALRQFLAEQVLDPATANLDDADKEADAPTHR